MNTLTSEERFRVQDYKFETSDFYHYFKTLYKDRGYKAFYQFNNRPHRRKYSRSLIKMFSPRGYGLEIGCGARTICPTDRTILSDGFQEHGVHDSIAKVFFKGDTIPYDSDSFDFLLSEHVLEHITNPIKALKEWLRVLKSQGVLFIFLPHMKRTNDKYRSITTLDHLIEDYKNNTPYNDSTHYDDWIQNVVKKGLIPSHYQRMDKQELLNSASIHHHVWTEKEIIELFNYLNLEILFVDEKVKDRRDSFAVIARKK